MWVFIFYSVGYNPVLSEFILMFKLFHIWPLVTPSGGLYIISTNLYLFLSTSQLPVSLLTKIRPHQKEQSMV